VPLWWAMHIDGAGQLADSRAWQCAAAEALARKLVTSISMRFSLQLRGQAEGLDGRCGEAGELRGSAVPVAACTPGYFW
jgi:hypothetical protein